MIDLNALQQQLQQPNLAPVEQWHPKFCGDIPLHIDAAGQWFYNHSLIQRPAMVKLFASVLLYQAGEYFLQTPVEKMRISVADAAFIITDWQWLTSENMPVLALTTSIGDKVLVSPEHPIQLALSAEQNWLPYVKMWRGLTAKLSRNVYYQLAEHVSAVYCNGATHYQLKSAGYPYTFAIAPISKS